jgi:hypothetical protein
MGDRGDPPGGALQRRQQTVRMPRGSRRVNAIFLNGEQFPIVVIYQEDDVPPSVRVESSTGHAATAADLPTARAALKAAMVADIFTGPGKFPRKIVAQKDSAPK